MGFDTQNPVQCLEKQLPNNLTEPYSPKPLTPTSISTTPSEFDDFVQRNIPLIPLPPLQRNSLLATFRFRAFSVYRRLFSVVFLGNLIAVIVLMRNHRTSTATLRAAAANLVICGLARVPFVVNLMYILTCAVHRTTPLSLRRKIAKIAHYGGVHSGCGVSGLLWYICYIAILTHDYASRAPPARPSTAVLVLSYALLILLLSMVVVAYPSLRFLTHNTFELTHRYSSWLLVILVWPTYMKAAVDAANASNTTLGNKISKDATFWFIIILTVSIISPWVTLRRVAVQPERLSNHAIRLHFKYTTTKFAQGVSVATNPLRDWHSFAGIPDSSGSGFSLVVSNAGDWTSACIRNAPTHLWKRAVPVYGFGRAVSIFRKALIVVTGSGIGPCLSLLSSNERPPLRILWQTRSPLKTYGTGILDAVAQLDPNALIIDTDTWGRQDMMQVSWSIVQDFSAEAVFVIARPGLVKQIVFGFETRGVPAYGPIFDS